LKKAMLYMFFMIYLLLPTCTFGQTITFTRQHQFTASRNCSFNDARAGAMQEAQSELLQELGVLVERRQRLVSANRGGNLQEDFVEEAMTYTAGRVQTTIVGDESFGQKGGGMIYSATFRMVVDTVALFAHLDNIVRQKEQARADSVAQAERVRNERMARENIISELEQTVLTARNLLSQEEQRERPIRAERDRKQQELQIAVNQRNNAHTAFVIATRASDAHTPIGRQRIDNEGRLLQSAEENQNRISSEFNVIEENLRNATARVEAARRNLREAENNLARETGVPIRTAESSAPTPAIATRINDNGFSERGFRDEEIRRKNRRIVAVAIILGVSGIVIATINEPGWFTGE
jgi:uncharacterized membrane protein